MKKTVVTVFIAMLVFTMFAQANDAVLEQVMLLRLAEKADVSDYVMVEILQGYRQYRSVLDDLDTERAEISIALLAAIKANESSSKLMSLTHELMDIDMEILETKQGAVDEAVSAIGAEAAAELYLVVSDLDKAKANLLAELSGKPDCSSCPNAAPACTAAVVANPEEAIMARVMLFFTKLSEKDLDGAMAAVADDFEHYDYKTKADLRDFLADAIATGFLDDIEIITDDAEVEIDGDEAVVYPIDITGMFGTATLELVGEIRDGQYMLTTIDAFGI